MTLAARLRAWAGMGGRPGFMAGTSECQDERRPGAAGRGVASGVFQALAGRWLDPSRWLRPTRRPPASLATRSPRRLEAFRRRWRLSLERRQAGQAPTQLRLTTCYDKVLSSGGRGCLGAPHEGWRCPCAAPTCLGGSAFRYVHVSVTRARASSWSSRVRPFGRGFSDGIPKGPRGFQRPAALGLWPVLRPPPPACRTRRAETTKVRGFNPAVYAVAVAGVTRALMTLAPLPRPGLTLGADRRRARAREGVAQCVCPHRDQSTFARESARILLESSTGTAGFSCLKLKRTHAERNRTALARRHKNSLN